MYDRLSKVLTDYKENLCTGKDLYDVLVEIQHSLEDMITVLFDNETSKQDTGRFNASDDSSDSLIIHTRDDRTDGEYDFTDEDVAEIEILCAKHTIYLYDGDGEKLDLSNKKLLGIDFSNKDLCGADLSNAVFVNCSFENASLCSADVRNAKFKNCNLKRLTAEESDFTQSKFFDCDLSRAFFTHSNFKDAEIMGSDVQGADFSSSCLEGTDTDGTDLYAAVTSNCSYDESEWLGEQEDEEDQGMTIGGM